MTSTEKELTRKGLVKSPGFVPDTVQYETIMGSMAYGVSNDSSDMDIYGFCIPPKDVIFPHLRGEIDLEWGTVETLAIEHLEQRLLTHVDVRGV